MFAGLQLKQVDDDYKLHLQAMLNRNVKATDKKGTSYFYKSINDFYNYEANLEKITGSVEEKIADPVLNKLILEANN